MMGYRPGPYRQAHTGLVSSSPSRRTRAGTVSSGLRQRQNARWFLSSAIASPWPGAFGLAAGFTVQALDGKRKEQEKDKQLFHEKVCADDACTAVAVKLGLKQVAPW